MFNNIDLAKSPFSRFGSYLTVVRRVANGAPRNAGVEPGLWLSGVHGFHGAREIFRLEPVRDGQPVDFQVEVEAAQVVLRCEGGEVALCIAEPELVRIRCCGVGLRLSLRDAKYNYAVRQAGPRWVINSAQAFLFHTAYPLQGDLAVRAPWRLGGGADVRLELTPAASGEGELALRQHVGFAEAQPVTGSYDEAVQSVAAEFAHFLAPYLPAPSGFEETVTRAAFLNWSCVVGPRGHFQRPSMLMSKNWMSNVWSWDHAINALALSAAHPELAWDQLWTVFDQQLPSGQLCDFVNDAVRLYNYVKPPIHGWVLARMLERHPWFDDPARLAAIHEPLVRWTEWWLRFRLRPGVELPEHYHGNDSGWDNASVFDAGTPAVSCDAAAFLVLQMETLGNLARRLGRAAEGARWESRATAMQARLLQHLWDGRRFTVLNPEGRAAERSDSLFTCLPVILGKRLPAAVRAALVREIPRFLTPWGLATEHPESPLYDPDGYWRGPIWAPPTLIIVDGLRQLGEAALAADIAQRFLRLCRQGGFAENFDALTGAPRCDPAYTWTASVCLEMARGLNPTAAR